MSRISTFPANELPADLVPLGADPFYGILAHRPEILREWSALDRASSLSASAWCTASPTVTKM